MTGSGNTWLTVVLPIWIGGGLLVLVQWLIMRRVLRKPPAHPDIVLAGRRLYEDGEFKREIVQRYRAASSTIRCVSPAVMRRRRCATIAKQTSTATNALNGGSIRKPGASAPWPGVGKGTLDS